MDFNTGLLRYGPQWRLHRKMFHVALSKESAAVFRPMDLQKVYQFIQNLLSNPQDYPLHCYTYVGMSSIQEISDANIGARPL